MSEELVGWGGPIPILAIFLLLFWRRLTASQRGASVAIVYVISILTGILSDVMWNVGSYPSAVIAGIIAPIIYCGLFSVVSQVLQVLMSKPKKREVSEPVAEDRSIKKERSVGEAPADAGPITGAPEVDQEIRPIEVRQPVEETVASTYATRQVAVAPDASKNPEPITGQPIGQISTPADAAEPSTVVSETNQWNPIIIAAIIQAVASVIVALIMIIAK